MKDIQFFINVYAVSKWCFADIGLCVENISAILFFTCIFTKYIATMLSEKKIEKVYMTLADNWLSLTDPAEHAVLESFARTGKILSIGYIVYLGICGTCFSQFTMVNRILDLILPLNESRPKLLIINGEYGFDIWEHYYALYFCYTIATMATTIMFMAIDTAYTVVVYQNLGIFSVVKYRLQKAAKLAHEKDAAYDIIVTGTQLHMQAIEFLEIIKYSYDGCIFVIICITFISLSTVVLSILKSNYDGLNLVKAYVYLLGLLIHFFYVNFPGQKLLDQSWDLFFGSYDSEWYNLSKKSRTLLQIIMMRCLKPCMMTAGGIYIMNFENYGSIIKTAMSYVTVVISL